MSYIEGFDCTQSIMFQSLIDEYVVDFVQQNGGIHYAEKRAKDFGDAARKNLTLFAPSEAKDSLLAFIDFVMEREK